MLITDNPERGLAVVVSQGGEIPRALHERLQLLHFVELVVESGTEAVATALRSHPGMIVIDGRGDKQWRSSAIAACATIKGDSYSGIIPLVAVSDPADLGAFFLAGADEVVHDGTAEMEVGVRVSAALARNERDTDVHPSTRLPGTRRIEAELRRRIESTEGFAVCYVDLDHFKEFNDRYGWHNGDQVIRLLARILHDVVKGLCVSDGFVGHIGGDDFLCVVPLGSMQTVCDEIVQVFDELIPLQYSEQDRRAGYFFGKDRRGQLHRVPLMTLSIGVATNQRRRFLQPGEVSELASEMKSYAKTLNGSVWAVDRRRDDDTSSRFATPVSHTPASHALTSPSTTSNKPGSITSASPSSHSPATNFKVGNSR